MDLLGFEESPQHFLQIITIIIKNMQTTIAPPTIAPIKIFVFFFLKKYLLFIVFKNILLIILFFF